jgi:apolipoprotein N-acyltransferase
VSARTRVALILLSASAYSACFPPLGWRWLAWIALAPGFAAIVAAAGAVEGALLGALWGVALSAGTAWWLPAMIAAYFESSLALGWVGLLVVAIAHAAVAYGAAGAWIAWTGRARAVGPIGIAAAWSSAELARTDVLGNPWAIAGYSQVDTPSTLQLADLAGVLGVGFVVLAVNAALTALACPAARGRRMRTSLALIGCLVVGTLAYGRLRLADASRDTRASLTVGIAQSGIGRDFRWRDEYRTLGVAEHLGPSERLRGAGADLLVWPEHAVSFYVQETTPEREELAGGLARLGADVVLGAPHFAPGPDGTTLYHNSIFLFRDGRIAGRYDKRRLLPLAETSGRTPYSPGRGPGVLRAGAARLGPLVCFEAMFPSLARRAVGDGAQVLVNLTNDSWFGAEAAARQHLEMAAVRAVETRRPLVRAAATGYSAVADAWGRIVARTGFGRADTLLAAVEPRDDLTAYAGYGDAPAAALLLIVVAWTTRARLTSGRRRS